MPTRNSIFYIRERVADGVADKAQFTLASCWRLGRGSVRNSLNPLSKQTGQGRGGTKRSHHDGERRRRAQIHVARDRTSLGGADGDEVSSPGGVRLRGREEF